jgi:hypothetical protein
MRIWQGFIMVLTLRTAEDINNNNKNNKHTGTGRELYGRYEQLVHAQAIQTGSTGDMPRCAWHATIIASAGLKLVA